MRRHGIDYLPVLVDTRHGNSKFACRAFQNPEIQISVRQDGSKEGQLAEGLEAGGLPAGNSRVGRKRSSSAERCSGVPHQVEPTQMYEPTGLITAAEPTPWPVCTTQVALNLQHSTRHHATLCSLSSSDAIRR